MHTLPLITEIPEGSKILLVDVQMSFIEQTDYFESEAVANRIDAAVSRMKDKLVDIKANGHEITAIYNGEDLHPFIDGVQDKLIENWEFYDEDNENRLYLNPEVAENYSKDDLIIVCGLWREMCVMSVAVLLHDLGYKAAMLLDEDLTLRSAMGWEYDNNSDLLHHCIENSINIVSLNKSAH